MMKILSWVCLSLLTFSFLYLVKEREYWQWRRMGWVWEVGGRKQTY